MDEELALFAATAERFAREVVAPRRAALDADGPALDEVLAAAGDLGLLALCAPAAAGGLAQDLEVVCAVVRPIARADAGVAAALLVQASAQRLLAGAGAWPDAVGASDLVTWPASGGATLRRSGGGDGAGALGAFVDGEAPLVPLAARARWLVARTAETIACCALDGAVRCRATVLGLASCAPADLRLAAAPVVATGATDADGDDLHAWASPAVAAIAVGLLEGAFATALDHARHRRQGGRFIVDWPEVRRLLAELRESAAVLAVALDGVLARRRRGDPAWPADAIALALRATDAACAGTTDGVQLHGGNGYMKEYPQERRLRDARQLRCLLGPAGERRARAFDAWLALAG